ncbi:MAG TPA: LolA-related protein [Steroidobacteraceae bacterium]|nr:LolA-related protein [Steroidobacteraceae bacterium]
MRYARRLARKNFFRGRREYVLVDCRKNVPVFQAPGKSFYDRSVAWIAGGMGALILMSASAICFAAQAGAQAGVGVRGISLDQLMKSLAQRRHGTVPYVEEDYLAILDRPVKSSGVLVYDAPDHLEKRTLKPKPQSLILQGDQLTVQRGHRTYQMQLSSYPQVAPFVDAVRETLAGDEEGLRKVFKVGLTGSLEDWRLRLVPLDEAVARKVERVEIAGARDEIRSVAILQVDGDRSLMTLGAPAAASGAAR